MAQALCGVLLAWIRRGMGCTLRKARVERGEEATEDVALRRTMVEDDGANRSMCMGGGSDMWWRDGAGQVNGDRIRCIGMPWWMGREGGVN